MAGIENALRHAARYSTCPTYSLILVDPRGERYSELALQTGSAKEMSDEWLKRVGNPEIMLVRCDGVNVDLSVK